MKFKTSAIALAVAGIAAAPVAVQAGDGEAYASMRVGIQNVDSGGVSELDVRSFSSRFGAKGETDLGNGMTGFGKFEWDVDLEREDIGARLRYVGVKGDFGSLLLGKDYHTFYSHTVGPVDNVWWNSDWNVISYTGRTDSAITYSGGTDAISFGVTAYFDADYADETAAVAPDLTTVPIGLGSAATEETGDEGVDGFEVGASFGIGDMTLGVALQDIEAVDNAVTAVTLSGIALGDASFGISFQANDDDTGVLFEALMGGAYLHIEQVSWDAADIDPMSITLGYSHDLGRNTTMWYEVLNNDADTGDSDADTTSVHAVLVYHIL